MQYIQGNSRHQTYFSTLENQVSVDNPVRLINGFADKLHLQKSGFTETVQAAMAPSLMPEKGFKPFEGWQPYPS